MEEEFEVTEPDAIIQGGDFTATQADIESEADFTELTAIAADAVGADHKEARRLIKAFLNTIQSTTAKRGYVQLHGFGSFNLDRLAARAGVDPRGNAYSVGERVTVEFNPFKEFREQIELETGLPSIR